MIQIAGLLAVTLAASQNFDAFFQQFAEKRDEIELLRARIEQKSITPDDELNSTGEIVYAKPKRLIFRYDDPETGDPLQVFVIDQDRYYEYDAELRQVQVYDIADRPEAEAFFLPFRNDTTALKDAYDVELLQGGPGSDVLPIVRLTPHESDQGETAFEHVTIRLGEQHFLPSRIHIQNDAESHVYIDVTDYTINPPDAERRGRFQVPAGVDVFEDDRFVTRTGDQGMLLPPPRADRPGTLETEDLPPGPEGATP